jgi:hypothetical protein
MTSFKASVQYGDWTGTAAADNADQVDLDAYLRETGAITADEFLFAVELYVGENHGGRVTEPHIDVLVFPAQGFDNVAAELADIEGPIPLRRVSVAMTLGDFLAKFKRVSIHLNRRGLDVSGREYIEVEG